MRRHADPRRSPGMNWHRPGTLPLSANAAGKSSHDNPSPETTSPASRPGAAGILVAMFITSVKVGRTPICGTSSRVLGGTVILEVEPVHGQAVQLVDHHEYLAGRAADPRQAGHHGGRLPAR